MTRKSSIFVHIKSFVEFSFSVFHLKKSYVLCYQINLILLLYSDNASVCSYALIFKRESHYP